MTSPRKADANRRNALASTGPRTLAGKVASSANALRHGLTSRAVVVPGEDPAELDAFEASVRQALAPVGALEELLTDRVVSVAWRMRRAAAVDAGLYARAFHERATKRARAEARTFERNRLLETFAGDTEITDERRHAAALRRADEASDALDEGAAGLAESFAPTADEEGFSVIFERLARYEGALSREMFRALHELERLQARRAGAYVPPPLVADVDVTLSLAGAETP